MTATRGMAAAIADFGIDLVLVVGTGEIVGHLIRLVFQEVVEDCDVSNGLTLTSVLMSAKSTTDLRQRPVKLNRHSILQ